MGSTSRDSNNFDLIRFVLSFAVYFLHVYTLSGREEFAWFWDVISSHYVLHSFFVVSGYLVIASFENSRSARDYYGKRIRRIVPAYFTVITLLVLLGALVGSLPPREYFLSLQTWKYYFWNLLFLNFAAPDLPGVFTHNPLQAVNGALWTLKVEVIFYALVPVLVWTLRRYGKLWILVSLYLFAVGWMVGFDYLYRATGNVFYAKLALQTPGELAYFMGGGLLFYYGKQLSRALPWLAAASTVFLLVKLPGLMAVLGPMALSIVVIYLAVQAPFVGNFGKFGDMSYGLYITHYPLTQYMVSIGAFNRDPYFAMFLTLFISLALAYVSWHVIEKPFLKRGSHYVVVNTAG